MGVYVWGVSVFPHNLPNIHPLPTHKPFGCGGALVHQTSWSKGETGLDNVRR